MVKIEDIIFWLIIIFIIGIALWLLHGSPTEEGAIISIGMAIVSSELMIWKKFYSLEKKTAISFIKTKNEIKLLENNMNHRFDNIADKLNLISNKIKK
jgi:hypothetical protein